MRHLGILLAAGAIAMGAISAAPASAAITCSYDGTAKLLTVEMSAAFDNPLIQRTAGGDIQIVGVTCSGSPTVTNTANILINDNSGGATAVNITFPAQFVPGAQADEDSVPEIEFVMNLGSGFDQVSLDSSDGASRVRVGTGGVNFNEVPGDTDPDIIFIGAHPERYFLIGSSAFDLLTGQGGGGSGAPFSTGTVSASGLGDGDVIEGGNGANASLGDALSGGAGSDTVHGFGSIDSISADPGDDWLRGGDGSEDVIDFSSAGVGVTVDLASVDPQANGPMGTDTLSGFEGVRGSSEADILSGDGFGNFVDGLGGNDLLNGRGGSDGLTGGNGTDTASYADSTGGVQVDLTAGTATGAAGNDSVTTTENLIGSPFGDTLTGTALANSITGLGGNDTVSALAGPDSVDVRDGGPDTASCGTEIDSATADQASVDNVNADCENVSFLAEPDTGGGGGNGDGDGSPAPPDALSFDLSGKATQRIVKQEGVIAKASCPLENCDVVVDGKAKVPSPKGARTPRAKFDLKPINAAVAAGVVEKVKLRLGKRRLQAAKAALRAGKTPKITVTASATDAAGNGATDSLQVKAKR